MYNMGTTTNIIIPRPFLCSDNPECNSKFVWTFLQIVMAGSVGKSYAGDIALDDISMYSGPCKVASSMSDVLLISVPS